jgi:hypothetical protein
LKEHVAERTVASIHIPTGAKLEPTVAQALMGIISVTMKMTTVRVTDLIMLHIGLKNSYFTHLLLQENC